MIAHSLRQLRLLRSRGCEGWEHLAAVAVARGAGPFVAHNDAVAPVRVFGSALTREVRPELSNGSGV